MALGLVHKDTIEIDRMVVEYFQNPKSIPNTLGVMNVASGVLTAISKCEKRI